MTVRRIVWTITPVVILTFGLAQGQASADVIALWQFGEKAVGSTGSVGDAITDSSGNSHNGAIVNNSVTYVAGAPGFDGRAIHFAGNAWAAIPGSASFAFYTTSFTLEAEIRTTQTTRGVIASDNMGNASPPNAYFMRVESDTLAGSVEGVVQDGFTSNWLPGNTVVADGNWHHVAMVWKASAPGALQMYLDYSLDKTISVSAFGYAGDASAAFNIGAKVATGTEFLTGDLDFVRLSSGALAPADMLHGVPEPGTLVLLATGLLGLLAYAWRKRK